jgi:hypothetical protein
LISLYITEHIAGVTALFLAVPITVFIIQILIGPSAFAKTTSAPALAQAAAAETPASADTQNSSTEPASQSNMTS